MADSQNRVPGDPGYDPSSDSNNTNNGNGTFTDNQGNIMDSSGTPIGNSIAAPQSTPQNLADSMPAQDLVQPQPTGNVLNISDLGASTGALPDVSNTNQIPNNPSNPGNPGNPSNPSDPSAPDFSGLLNGLDSQLAALMSAMSSTNAQDFAEKVREFNIGQQNWQQQFQTTVGALTGQYNGQPTLQAQQDAQQNALGAANLTGWYYQPQTLNGTSTGASGASSGGSTPLSGYPAGTVVRTASNQFGVVNANGTITPGDASNPTIFAAIQGNTGIATIPDSAFSGATAAATPAPTAGGTGPNGSPGGNPIQTLAGQQQQANLTGMFNGAPTPAYQQELSNIAAQIGQLTGQYNGAPTEAAREFNVNTQSDLAKMASSLTGPSNYFQYLNAQNAGNSILGNLYSGQAMPQGGAPVGNTMPQSLNNILGGLGLGTSGQSADWTNGGYAPGTTSTTSNGQVNLPYGMGTMPTPNQIQPTAWNSMSPSAQQFLGGAYAAAGYDPSSITGAIASETPATGAAPSTGSSSTNFAGTGSQSLFG